MKPALCAFLSCSLALLASCAPTEDEGSSQSSRSAHSSSALSTALSSQGAGNPLPPLNTTGLPLTIPQGFAIETIADKLSGARVMVRDGFGNMWVSRPQAGIVTQVEMSGSTVVRTNDMFRGLDRPHGLAIDPQNSNVLYIAEETRIRRAHLYSDAPLEEIAQLPAGGRHWTRTIGFGPSFASTSTQRSGTPDEQLYVSLGSTCDVCVEQDDEIAAIISMNRDGSDRTIIASGLRNAVFFTWHPVDGSMWATEMGRDMLGDTLPPEEINVIIPGRTYGWPYCYGNRVRDTSFQSQTAADCSQTEPPRLTLPAHVAPLGLAFIPEEGWPEEYWYDLLVAQHGSWNSSTRVGYSIVRIPLDARGNPEGEPVDFVTGFLSGNRVHGRPVGIVAEPGGILYITDDEHGAVYRMRVRDENSEFRM